MEDAVHPEIGICSSMSSAVKPPAHVAAGVNPCLYPQFWFVVSRLKITEATMRERVSLLRAKCSDLTSVTLDRPSPCGLSQARLSSLVRPGSVQFSDRFRSDGNSR
jgi:hypothetical protein